MNPKGIHTVRRNILLYTYSLAAILILQAQAQSDIRETPASSNPTNNIQSYNSPKALEKQEKERHNTDTRNQQEAQSNYRDSELITAEPNIEFEEFVASSLGHPLPIFGQNLFRNVPSTFAPLDQVQVTSDYVIGPGDELFIRAWGAIEINYRAVVDRAGSIELPKVGAIHIAGQHYEHVNDFLKKEIGHVFKNFELNVTLGQLRSIQIVIVGQAKRPGSYTVSSLSTLMNALFYSGGPSKRGSMRNIQLKRKGKDVTTFDLYELIVNGNTSNDIQLLPGDVIYIPPVGRLVALAGSVNNPAIFELKDHDKLARVINYAGGITSTAAGQRAILESIDERLVRKSDEVPLTPEGLNRELNDGDVVRFFHVSLKFENAITLRGNVAVPGRYPWHDGMRVKDLIPNRDFLITDEYWKRQNKLALNPDGESFQLREERLIREENERSLSSPAVGAPNSSGNRMYDDSKLLADRSQTNNISKKEELSQRMGKTEAQRVKQEELKNEVSRSTAEINWEYAVIQRMKPEDLTSQLIPFNLRKAIANETDQNISLHPGDVITVFSQNDIQVPIAQQSKFIRLEGEFRSAGVYQAETGETLRHLINRVDGFSPQAYLYGAEFTRESTREDQQKRMDQYVNDLEKAIDRNASTQRSLTGEEVIAERQAVEGQRRLLDKLRVLKANGRIVLELKPSTNNLDEIPDLVLEDGDRFYVPFRPDSVNVIGSVYNSNSYLFKANKTFADYLRLAGGASRNGDKSKTFIIRADGSILSMQGHTGLFWNNFDNTRLLPGDTIVVPERLDKGLVLRGFKDWTQIIGQFVIGAAAAKVLFP